MAAPNSWDIPEWHAINRECALVRDLIGSGATAVGRATYADQLGQYYTAFFGLSVGIERLCKLVLVVDYALTNGGRMPPESVVRKYGHDLSKLVDKVDQLATHHGISLRFRRPTDAIARNIVECLNAFADARRGRYANFGSLDNPNLSSEEPIQKWWKVVAVSILAKHYENHAVQQQVETNATAIDKALSGSSLVLYMDETGQAIQDPRDASIRTGQTKIVQKYGRYHALTIARWLCDVYSQLAQSAACSKGITAFDYSWGILDTYAVGDAIMKNRRVWPRP